MNRMLLALAIFLLTLLGLPAAQAAPRHKVTKRQIYSRSNAITSVRLPGPGRFAARVASVRLSLDRGQRLAVQRASQRLTDGILAALGVGPVRVRVMAARPIGRGEELQGLYESTTGRARPVITVWMRTARRKQVVAFNVYLRTLLHEIGHHLDYEFFHLGDSLHTQGFYARESSLFDQLVPGR